MAAETGFSDVVYDLGSVQYRAAKIGLGPVRPRRTRG